jgi:L-lactate dehydrogenase complex protein LldF
VTVPGPIGSVLAPHVDKQKHASLPFASSLCGSCSDVCPVRINLHEQLLAWRQELPLPLQKRVVSRAASWVLRSPLLYRFFGAVARWLLPKLPKALVRRLPWGRDRELPQAPRASFREQFAELQRARTAAGPRRG